MVCNTYCYFCTGCYAIIRWYSISLIIFVLGKSLCWPVHVSLLSSRLFLDYLLVPDFFSSRLNYWFRVPQLFKKIGKKKKRFRNKAPKDLHLSSIRSEINLWEMATASSLITIRWCSSSPAEVEASSLFKLSLNLFYCDFRVYLFVSGIICMGSWVTVDLNKDWWKQRWKQSKLEKTGDLFFFLPVCCYFAGSVEILLDGKAPSKKVRLWLYFIL